MKQFTTLHLPDRNEQQHRPSMIDVRLEKPKPKDRRNTIRSNFGMADVYWLLCLVGNELSPYQCPLIRHNS